MFVPLNELQSPCICNSLTFIIFTYYCAHTDTPTPKENRTTNGLSVTVVPVSVPTSKENQTTNGFLVTVIPVSVLVGGLLPVIMIIVLVTVGILIVRQKKQLAHDNEHIYESVSLYAMENITLQHNDAYVSGTCSFVKQQNMAGIENLVSHCSHAFIEEDGMRDNADEIGSAHELEQDASVCYQTRDNEDQCYNYEQADDGECEQVTDQDNEQTSDSYDRVEDYEQTSDPYGRVGDYEHTSDPYDRVHDYEQQQASGPYDQVQNYERLYVCDRQVHVEDYEHLQASGPTDPAS